MATSLSVSRLLSSSSATAISVSNPLLSPTSVFTAPVSFTRSLAPNLSLKFRSSSHTIVSTTRSFSTTITSAISVGDKLPDSTLSYLDPTTNDVKTVTVSSLTAGKKTILFAVPGAFTPTCSQKHVPGFVSKAAELRSKGVDVIACVSVNDAFVMEAWRKDLGINDEVMLLSDGNGEFTGKLGVELDLRDKPVGLGVRSRRYAILAEDGVVNKFRQPYSQATSYCSLVLHDQTWPWTEELDALLHMEAEDLVKFVPMMLSRAFVECYVAGNVDKEEAESMVKHVEDVLFKDPKPICRQLFPSQLLTDRVAELGTRTKYFYHQQGSNPKDENSALVHYIQVHQDEFSMNVKLQLFCLIAKQATFHQLRTVEQLGYITSLSRRNHSGVNGVQFIIQSSDKGPRHIDSRVESLLKDLESKFYNMSDEEFKSNVTALTDMKLEKHKNLSEESRFYWGEIRNGTLKFNRIEAEVAALREIKREELIDYFDEYIKIDAPKKKSLSIFVYGSQHLKEMVSDKAKVASPFIEIEDIVRFRNSLPLYRSLRG